MATNAPIPGGSGEIPPITPSRPIIPETPSEISASSNSLQPPPSSSDTDRIYIPSYSRWFSWNEINECEVRSLPEFFDSRSSSKNPRVYLYLRNSIIKQYRDEHPQKISFTDVRRTLVGDVVSIRRVFDFLDSWGLINYSGSASAKPLKWDDKEAVASEPPSAVKESAKRICNGCKSVCSVACFASEKRGQRDGGEEESQLLEYRRNRIWFSPFQISGDSGPGDGAWLRETPSAAWIYVPRRRRRNPSSGLANPAPEKILLKFLFETDGGKIRRAWSRGEISGDSGPGDGAWLRETPSAAWIYFLDGGKTSRGRFKGELRVTTFEVQEDEEFSIMHLFGGEAIGS
ncbi:hypothetical protein F2Q70_00028319 [Brassica cretica]|uniref:SWIRM domain-containing protein n=1 Tax=Brassica cretica TaxID=69181 RepID=A0A8S9L9F0_BRACR|nr:hypothetical protein F2Q70_00028319 [Brassica cretica]